MWYGDELPSFEEHLLQILWQTRANEAEQPTKKKSGIMLDVAVTPKNIHMMIISMLIECYLLPPTFVLYEMNINLLKPLFLFFILDVRRMNTSLFNNSTTRPNKRTSYTILLMSQCIFLSIWWYTYSWPLTKRSWVMISITSWKTLINWDL